MSNDDELIERIAAELRSPVRVRADFDERVMGALPARRASWLGGVAGWFVRPKRLELSPLGVLAAAAVAVALVVAVTWELARRDAAPAAPYYAAVTGERDAVRVVQFVLVAPAASRVTLVGDFNGWDIDATPMQKGGPGVWSVSLPLPVGRHQYAFVLDDEEWVADPAAPPAVSDDFGSPSSVVTVAMVNGA